MKTTIGVVFGGRSGEHEISIRSAGNVINALDRDRYEIIPIAITAQGEWLNPSRSADLLDEEVRSLVHLPANVLKNAEVGLRGDPTHGGLMVINDGEVGSLKVDVVFPALHGTFGEDGTIQGLLEMAGIPYVGCGVLGSACGMDKVVMKSLFAEANLPMCKYLWFVRRDWESNPNGVVKQIEASLGYPVFVKPANLGSSVGISKAGDAESMARAINLAAEYDRKIIVEEALNMREIECAVLGNEEPEASLPGEYVIKDKSKAFLDFDEKYAGTGNNDFVVPSPVSEELATKIRQMAIKAFKAIDGSGLARVDFFLKNDTGSLLVNEINTMPGLTDASGYPKMWTGSGLPFTQLLDRLVDLAQERHRDRSRNRTTRT